MFSVHRPPRATATQSKRWCFTINNYVQLNEDSLQLLGPTCDYLVYGREVGASGTPHLQGFVIFHTNHRFNAVQAIFPTGAHLEKTGGPSHLAAAYCKKDHDFVEFGLCPAVQGKTSRYDQFRDWVVSHGSRPTMAEVAQEFPSIFMQSGRVQLFIDLVWPNIRVIEGEYRPYQQLLANELSGAFADPRKIIFVVDPQGNSGKSWFVDRFFDANTDSTQIFSGGNHADLAYALDERRSIFLFDLPRCSSEYVPYKFLEQLKDRRVLSTKYESRMKWLTRFPHVAVFTNEYPDMTKLSADRYEIVVWYNP